NIGERRKQRQGTDDVDTALRTQFSNGSQIPDGSHAGVDIIGPQ
ncbi:hypothetical protein MNBD_ACTINO01-397, partial [hydrothermal vent metagenome]